MQPKSKSERRSFRAFVRLRFFALNIRKYVFLFHLSAFLRQSGFSRMSDSSSSDGELNDVQLRILGDASFAFMSMMMAGCVAAAQVFKLQAEADLQAAAEAAKHKSKRKRGPRVLSGFNMFIKNFMLNERKEGQGVMESMKTACDRWRSISEEQHAAWQHTADEYNKAHPVSEKEESDDSETNESDMPKRPAGAFFRFRAQMVDQLRSERTDSSYIDLMKELGVRWHALSSEEREVCLFLLPPVHVFSWAHCGSRTSARTRMRWASTRRR
jgi:hypothetical protein